MDKKLFPLEITKIKQILFFCGIIVILSGLASQAMTPGRPEDSSPSLSGKTRLVPSKKHPGWKNVRYGSEPDSSESDSQPLSQEEEASQETEPASQSPAGAGAGGKS